MSEHDPSIVPGWQPGVPTAPVAAVEPPARPPGIGPLRTAGAAAAALSALAVGWLQTANLPRPVVGLISALLVGAAGRAFPSLTPKLVAAANDPQAILTVLLTAAITAGVAWLAVPEAVQAVLGVVLAAFASAVIPSLRDTLGTRAREGSP